LENNEQIQEAEPLSAQIHTPLHPLHFDLI